MTTRATSREEVYEQNRAADPRVQQRMDEILAIIDPAPCLDTRYLPYSPAERPSCKVDCEGVSLASIGYHRGRDVAKLVLLPSNGRWDRLDREAVERFFGPLALSGFSVGEAIPLIELTDDDISAFAHAVSAICAYLCE